LRLRGCSAEHEHPRDRRSQKHHDVLLFPSCETIFHLRKLEICLASSPTSQKAQPQGSPARQGRTLATGVSVGNDRGAEPPPSQNEAPMTPKNDFSPRRGSTTPARARWRRSNRRWRTPRDRVGASHRGRLRRSAQAASAGHDRLLPGTGRGDLDPAARGMHLDLFGGTGGQGDRILRRDLISRAGVSSCSP